MSLLFIPLQIFAEILRAELYSKAQRQEAERQIQLAKIEAAVRSETIQAQRHVAELLIATARHVFDRKIDVLHDSFNAILAIIQHAHESLVSERAALTATVITAKSRQDKLIATQRLAEIDRELARLEHEAATLHADMQAFLRVVDIQLPLPALQLLIH
jgi:hypothetical protein